MFNGVLLVAIIATLILKVTSTEIVLPMDNFGKGCWGNLIELWNHSCSRPSAFATARRDVALMLENSHE